MKKSTMEIESRPLLAPTDFDRKATKDIAGAMNAILAEVFALSSRLRTSIGT
jgi:starvation-inducible DNA-binding protein